MGGGTFRARAATAAALLAVAGCGSGATTTPTPAIFATSLASPAGAGGNPTTGQHWTGTEHTVMVFLPGCSVTVDGTLDMTVSSGQVTGTGTGGYTYLRTSCGTTTIVHQQTVPITGTASGTQFQLTIPFGFGGTGAPITVRLTSVRTAHANGTDQQGSATRTYTVDLTCHNC